MIRTSKKRSVQSITSLSAEHARPSPSVRLTSKCLEIRHAESISGNAVQTALSGRTDTAGHDRHRNATLPAGTSGRGSLPADARRPADTRYSTDAGCPADAGHPTDAQPGLDASRSGTAAYRVHPFPAAGHAKRHSAKKTAPSHRIPDRYYPCSRPADWLVRLPELRASDTAVCHGTRRYAWCILYRGCTDHPQRNPV